jgi:flagellar motility protein MotE (MotC chaperone)
LIYQDIRGERGAIDELRKQVSDELKAVDDKMAVVERRLTESEQKRQETAGRLTEMQKNLIEIEGIEQTNVKKMAEMYDSMDPESAAKILRQMADNKNIETAVKLLGQMKERQAAKVLAAIPDAGLAAQLLDRLKGMKRPSVATKKGP